MCCLVFDKCIMDPAILGVARMVRGISCSHMDKRKIRILFECFLEFFPFVLFSRRYGHYRHKYRDVLGQCCIYGDVVRVCALYGGLEVC